LLARIAELNADPAIHGILVQLPLPAHIDMPRVLETISVAKDVDGFHLYNIGALVTGNTVFSPCTPYGVVKPLESEAIELRGQNVVVVGASNIVGKPTALMLMAEGATVPGGVGPLTVTMLLENTVVSAERAVQALVAV
jgi:methylenetetrahydrofolate dehydrogenase (NADP+)/methenyltetrahydrofolate cyclohydrolase